MMTLPGVIATMTQGSAGSVIATMTKGSVGMGIRVWVLRMAIYFTSHMATRLLLLDSKCLYMYKVTMNATLHLKKLYHQLLTSIYMYAVFSYYM